MKILLLVEACGAGVGRHVIDLARGLAEISHDVHLLYSPLRADRAFKKGLNDLQNGFPNVHCIVLPMRRKVHPSDLAAAWHLRRYVRIHGPFNAIHSHSTKAGLVARAALLGLPGAQIYTPHAPLTMNPELTGLARSLVIIYERALAFLTTRIIAVSPEERDHLLGLGVQKNKLRLVPNGIDANGWPARGHKELGSSLCIGFLGRLVPQKDLGTLLTAFSQVSQPPEYSIVLAIAGQGAVRPELESLGHQLGITGRIRWLGECHSGVLQTFDILALSSRYEALPYVVLESMAAGVPAVCTRVGGIGLLIVEGVTGLTVPAGDVSAFASALTALVSDAALRRRMGDAARERAAAFSIGGMVRETLGVYLPGQERRKVSLKSVSDSAEQIVT